MEDLVYRFHGLDLQLQNHAHEGFERELAPEHVHRTDSSGSRTGNGTVGVLVEFRQFRPFYKQLDRPGNAGRSADEAALLQLEDHAMHRRGRYLEDALHVRFGGGPAVQDEKKVFETLMGDARTGPQKRRRAQILLACDRGVPDVQIAETLPCGTSTIYRTKIFLSRSS